ncbi:hypothetical protein FACS1894182_12940 [Bacteroidia bacterium]|nr:hypothetical protein FACS1894182_12940 [Bacteroidia bacterium]
MFGLMDDYVKELNKKLILSLDKTDYSLELANGKMGFCIYFYVTGFEREYGVSPREYRNNL